jgi:hypothetical protein
MLELNASAAFGKLKIEQAAAGVTVTVTMWFGSDTVTRSSCIRSLIACVSAASWSILPFHAARRSRDSSGPGIAPSIATPRCSSSTRGCVPLTIQESIGFTQVRVYAKRERECPMHPATSRPLFERRAHLVHEADRVHGSRRAAVRVQVRLEVQVGAA